MDYFSGHSHDSPENMIESPWNEPFPRSIWVPETSAAPDGQSFNPMHLHMSHSGLFGGHHLYNFSDPRAVHGEHEGQELSHHVFVQQHRMALYHHSVTMEEIHHIHQTKHMSDLAVQQQASPSPDGPIEMAIDSNGSHSDPNAYNYLRSPQALAETSCAPTTVSLSSIESRKTALPTPPREADDRKDQQMESVLPKNDLREEHHPLGQNANIDASTSYITPGRRNSIPTAIPTPRTPAAPAAMAPKRRSALPVPPRTKSKDKERDVPATIPVVENIDGVEWFTIEYAVKKDKKVYRIRTDIDDISVETLPTDFKSDNCVYSKAFCPRSQYKGHRWNYENSVNIVGWKLCWKNSEICGQKGLIQRAVDCFRNRFPELRSRRVVRQEKKVNGVLRSRRIKSGSANAGTPYPRTERCLRSVKSVTPSEVDPDSDDDTDAVASAADDEEGYSPVARRRPGSAPSAIPLRNPTATPPEPPVVDARPQMSQVLTLVPLTGPHVVGIKLTRKPNAPKSLTFESIVDGQLQKTRIFVNIEACRIHLELAANTSAAAAAGKNFSNHNAAAAVAAAVATSPQAQDFKRLNCVYPRAVGDFNHFKRSFPFAHLVLVGAVDPAQTAAAAGVASSTNGGGAKPVILPPPRVVGNPSAAPATAGASYPAAAAAGAAPAAAHPAWRSSAELMAARYATEVICNEIGWRLAYLNPRLVGRINLLQKALDAYRDKFGTGSALFDPPIF